MKNEPFGCLARHGYHFGHGHDGLADLLVAINLLACAFLSVLDSVRVLWCQLRNFYQNLRVAVRLFVFPHWTALPKKRLPSVLVRGLTRV